MPQNDWSAKRERQYAHIKESLQNSGNPEPKAEKIAARVVNKARAQRGESVTASASSTRQRGVKGRSTMNKAQLEAVLTR